MIPNDLSLKDFCKSCQSTNNWSLVTASQVPFSVPCENIPLKIALLGWEGAYAFSRAL